MCLELRQNSTTPYNAHRIRWKVAIRWRNGQLESPYKGRRYSRKGEWMRARTTGLPTESAGFHVFVSRNSAIEFEGAFRADTILRVEVRGFLRSGMFSGQRCETWREMRILSVYHRPKH